MTDLTMGQIIDALRVNHTVDDGELVAGAVVLLEIIEADGDTRLSICWNEGQSFLKRAGMLHHALAMEV